MKSDITQEYLKEYFSYRKDGNLVRKKTINYASKKGMVVGHINRRHNRRYVSIKNKHKFVHRMIFLLHHGYLPKYIDHIDGNSLNNRIENLQEVNMSQNLCKGKLRKNNKSGYPGVSFSKEKKKWEAYIKKNYKRKFLGYFDKIEDAIVARKKAEKKYFKKFTPIGVE